MKNSNSTSSQGSSDSADPQETGYSPWEQLKSKRIAYLTLPLLVMATIVEFVILATGWKYQQMVCLPQGMGVTFFGIGPIGATILAVELLKLPLAIWTASRIGWQKGFMLFVGLPLICVLTFQLVKDMAVYEMGTAMKPASHFLEQAAAEEIKVTQLKGELTAIEEKKTERERKLAEWAAKHAKAKADLEESLKRNDANRQDAITLTEYQKKELSEVEARQATIIKQFDADTEQLTKSLTDLRARRETELARATTWNVEEARIENAYKTKLAAYTNKKTAYEKDKAEYESAGYLKRKLMREPVDPGVPPERESNKILKPTLVADLEAQIKAKEAELASVNNKRRDRVAQVDADARRLREEFDRRSGTKREETDRKREELSAALAAAVTEWKAEEKQMDQDLAAAVKKVDGIRGEIDAARKKADGFYEAREAAIRNTQVHRIATTVEIVRGLLMGERPMSIKATAKERGDILTDQISMVRIWVYPVLAFIVAFLPTLMVEIGFSTIFKPEQQRPAFRLGFLGRRLHWLYTRAGRQKILRAERMARDATSQIAIRDKALAAANAATEKALAEKRAEVRDLDEAIASATATYEEQLKAKQSEWEAKREKALAAANAATERALAEKRAEVRDLDEALASATAAYEEQLKTKQSEWDGRFASLTESLNQALVEKDALRDFQQTEIERQVQLRQNVWSDRLAQMGQQLETQHATHEAERTAMVQEHQKKLMEISEDCRAQVTHARRQMADAELAAEEATAKLALESKESLNARETACSQLQLQVESLSLKLTQAREDAAREMEKAARQEKHRLERQQMEFAKTLRQRNEELEHQLKLREQELALEFDTRAAQEQAKVEQAARDREEKFERQVEARIREVDARWSQEVQQREEAAQVRLKQRELQLQAQAEVRLSDLRMQNEQEFRRRELEFDRQLDAQSREADSRLREELQQKELAFHARLKQREQELTAKSAAREIELQNQLGSALRTRDEEWEKQAESRVRATETRLGIEAKQQEEIFQQKWRQREQQLQAQFEVQKAEMKTKWDQDLRDRQQEWERNAEANARANESRWMAEMQQKEELLQSKSRQRDQHWQAKLDNVRVELQAQNEQELRRREVESADARQRALRELEASLRKEMLENDDAAQAEAKQREREFSAQLAAQAEAHQIAAQEWKTELEIMRGNIEPFQVLLARTEKERDEARKSAEETARQAQELEKKLSEASSFLSGWKNGKNPVAARAGRDGLQIVRSGLEESSEQ
jgi:hypothetical protein